MSQIDARFLARFWIDEIPSGLVDGSNLVYNLSEDPVENAAVELFMDGLYLSPTADYSITGKVITMAVAPVAGQVLRASYIQKRGGS